MLIRNIFGLPEFANDCVVVSTCTSALYLCFDDLRFHLVWSNFECVTRPEVTPVSYTHLTLPTMAVVYISVVAV